MFFPVLVAAQDPAPQFTMAGQGAQPGFTNNTSIYTDWTWPTIVNCPNGQSCHFEYCFTQHQAGYPNSLDYCVQTSPLWKDGNYTNTPFALNLSIGSNPYTVCAEYRIAAPGPTYYPSYPTCVSVTYNPPGTGDSPVVSVISPVGISDSVTGMKQAQYVDGDYAQAVTYSASSPVGESVTAAIAGCTSPTACATPFVTGFAPASGAPYLWDWSNIVSWWQNDPSTDGYFIQVTATDEANNSTASIPPSSTSLYFNIFDASTAPQALTCNGSTANCVILADGTGENGYQGDIPGDMPNGEYTSCQSNSVTIAFEGYGDPSMRADAVPSSSNQWGTNLWMLYSFAKFQQITGANCDFTGVIEIHLAESQDGGQTWGAWCDNCSTVTPIYPSLKVANCSINDPYFTYSGLCYTSHEVPNFWQDASTNTWYGVHLMYNIPPAGLVNNGTVQYAVTDGCLVVSMAPGPPNNLAWLTTSTQPTSCGATSLPTDNGQSNQILSFSTMTGLANPAGGCTSWGEPAIMVTSLPTGGPMVYLAAECFLINEGLTGSNGYYIFVNNTSLNQTGGWSVYNFAGTSTPFTFGLAQLPLPSSFPLPPSGSYNAVTEFDWAVRPDTSMAAVITPQAAALPPAQGPCAVLGFNLLASPSATPGTPNAIFPAYIGYVNDNSPPPSGGGIGEAYGPNGCTYEPTSNTGVPIVRHFFNTSLTYPFNASSFQQFSIIMSGLLP